MRLFEMKSEREAALREIDAIRAQGDGKVPPHMQGNYSDLMIKVGSLDRSINEVSAQNTFTVDGRPGQHALSARAEVLAGRSLPGERVWGDSGVEGDPREMATGRSPMVRTSEYRSAFHTWLKSKGSITSEALGHGADGLGGFLLPGSERFVRNSNYPSMSAALDEGTSSAGGYIVPSIVVQQVVPLGMPDLGIFNESMVMPTENDLKLPIQASFGQAAAKSESGASTNAFTEIDPTIGQITLSAYMAGGLRLLSWELVQDAPVFASFATEDLVKAQLIFEGNLYVNGTGTGQAQGLLGNVGTGTASAYELIGTAATDAQTLLNAVFDIVGTLKAAYQPNAVFVMARATAMALRRAQMQTNLLIPVIATDAAGVDRLLGHRIAYDSNMPLLPAATSAGVTPILFGSFKDGYLIGVRGGSGINVKVLDQPWAIDGQLGLIAYRRVDGRVRRSEAIQGILVSHS